MKFEKKWVPGEPLKVGHQFRGLLDKKSELIIDKEARTIEFPFSSEYPVERYFGIEILSHDPGAADLDRLNNKHPLLYNHDKKIGVIEKAWLGDDRRLWCKARFGKSKLAEEIFQDVIDEITTLCSFGYQIVEARYIPGDEEKVLVTKWMAFEVSLVDIPADPTVGLGRELERSEVSKEVVVKVLMDESSEKQVKTSVEKPSTELPLPTATRNEGGLQVMDPKDKDKEPKPVDEKEVRSQAAKDERDRISAINSWGEKHGKRDLANSLINSGKSIEEARAAFFESIPGATQVPVTQKEGEIGLSDKDVRKFSFVKILRALANPTDKKIADLAKFEREVSDEAASKAGKSAQGFMVPVDVLRAANMELSRRDLNVGTSTAGGHTVATDLLVGSFIDILRNKSVCQRAGATVFNGLVGNISIPRQSGGATAYLVAESGDVTESQQTFDQVTMSPKTVGALTEYTRKLLLQSSIDIENFIKKDLATVLALKIDALGLYGTGSANQPTGIKNTSGINTKDFAANTPTFPEIVDLETLVAADNADVGALKYLVNPTGRGALKSAEKFASTGQTIWEPGNSINGFGAEVSSQIEANDFWYGNWADLVFGFWSGLDLTVDPYTKSASGGIRIVALQDFDVAARHPESFCRGNNTL